MQFYATKKFCYHFSKKRTKSSMLTVHCTVYNTVHLNYMKFYLNLLCSFIISDSRRGIKLISLALIKCCKRQNCVLIIIVIL